MGAKSSMVERSKSPGPGAYDASDRITKDKSPSFRMGGLSARLEGLSSKQASELPGPGAYDQSSNFGKNGRAFKFQGKPDTSF